MTQSQVLNFRVIVLVFGTCFLVLPTALLADTQVTKNITTNTTWNEAAGPYVIQNDITVATGTTLTIGTGTVVKFAGPYSLRFNGTLKAGGTATKKVTFTSIKDDSVGGDTNRDGSASAPAAEDWQSLVFLPGSVGVITHSNIRYAGYAYRVPDASPAIYNLGGNVSVSNSEVKNSFLFGVGQTAGQLKLSSNTISQNNYGVAIKGGSVDLTSNKLSGNSIGLIDDGNATIKLSGNTFQDGDAAIVFYPNKQRSIVESNNKATGNTHNGLMLVGLVKATFTLSKSGSLPYIVQTNPGSGGMGKLTFDGNNLAVAPTGHLKLVAGTIIKFGEGANLPVEGSLTVSGTQSAPVVFTSIFDNTYGGDTWDRSDVRPRAGDWGDIQLKNKSKASISRSIFRYGGESQYNSGAILFNQGGTLSVAYSSIADSEHSGIRHDSGTTTLRYNTIVDHLSYGVFYNGAANGANVDARLNFWGDPVGPFHPTTNPKGFGISVSDKVLFKSFLTTPNATTPALPCCSSVLFLPGIMGTRLFDAASLEQYWEPKFITDISKLALYLNGTSIFKILALGVIDTIPTDGSDIYKSLISDLEKMKTSGLVKDYSAHGYDWRLSLTNILADNKLEDKVRELAKNSKTGKVTIIAHSNGGLLAKALINELGSDADIVDDLVMVAVPQLGTPQAVGALLHGYSSGIPKKWPVFIPEARMRSLASTTSAIYNLLPHSDYYSSAGASIYDPLITFEPGVATNKFINRYGYGVSNYNELYEFLYGAEGRGNPAYTNTTEPARIHRSLLDRSINEVLKIDSRWMPPAGLRIHQIAGVGVLTPQQINYSTDAKGKILYGVKRTVDGDETVIEPSALAMSTSSHMVRRWWVNLEKYNGLLVNDREHADITEVEDLRSFIFNNIVGTSTSYTYAHLSKTRPIITGIDRLSFILHSPLSLSYVESDGTIVDEIKPNGKNSKFNRYGEVQIIDVYNGEKGELQLTGERDGSFTLDVEEVIGKNITSATTFDAIPSSATTKALLRVLGQRISDIMPLVIDYEGDGINDFSLQPHKGDSANLEEAVLLSPSSKELLEELKNYTEDISKQVLDGLQAPTDGVSVEIEVENINYNELENTRQ